MNTGWGLCLRPARPLAWCPRAVGTQEHVSSPMGFSVAPKKTKCFFESINQAPRIADRKEETANSVSMPSHSIFAPKKGALDFTKHPLPTVVCEKKGFPYSGQIGYLPEICTTPLNQGSRHFSTIIADAPSPIPAASVINMPQDLPCCSHPLLSCPFGLKLLP